MKKDIGQSILREGMQRLLGLAQNEYMVKGMMCAVSLPGKVQSFKQEQVAKFIKSMKIATEEEVIRLKRTVYRLEEEIEQLRKAQKSSTRISSPKRKTKPKSS